MTSESFLKKHFKSGIVSCFTEGMVMYDLFGNYDETTINIINPMSYFVEFKTQEDLYKYINDFSRAEVTRYGKTFLIQLLPYSGNTMQVTLSYK